MDGAEELDDWSVASCGVKLHDEMTRESLADDRADAARPPRRFGVVDDRPRMAAVRRLNPDLRDFAAWVDAHRDDLRAAWARAAGGWSFRCSVPRC